MITGLTESLSKFHPTTEPKSQIWGKSHRSGEQKGFDGVERERTDNGGRQLPE